MVIGGLLKAIKHLSTLAKVGESTGRIPILNVALKAVKNPEISRKKFLNMIGGGTRELMAQSKYLASIDKFKENSRLAKIALSSDSNQRTSQLLNILKDKVSSGVKASKAARIAKDAKRIGKDKALYKKLRDHSTRMRTNESLDDFYPDLMAMSKTERFAYIKNLRKDILSEFDGQSKSERLKELANFIYRDNNVAGRLTTKHMKSLDLTKDKVRKYKDLVEKSKHGYTGFRDPDLKNFYKTREKYSDVTGMGHVEVQSMAHRAGKTGGASDLYATPRYKGIDVDKKVTKEVDEITSPIKDIMKGLRKAFDEGLAGD